MGTFQQKLCSYCKSVSINKEQNFDCRYVVGVDNCVLIPCETAIKKVNQSHYRPEVPRGFQEVKVPRLRDNGPGWW